MRFWITAIIGIVVISGLSTAMYVWNPETFTSRPVVFNKLPTKPLDPAEGKKIPKIEYDQTLIDVENVKQLTEGETKFEMRNEGEDVLQLRLGSKSCTCAAIRIDKNGKTLTRFAKAKELEDRERGKHPEQDPRMRDHITDAVEGKGNINPAGVIELAPGEKADFVIEWDSKDQIGTKQIGGDVFTNDPRSGKKSVSFELRLHIVPEILFDPGYVNFGQLRDGQRREETLNIYSLAHDNLEVKYLSSSTPALSATLRPMNDEEKAKFSAGSGFVATVVIDGHLAVGDMQEKILFETNIEGNKEAEVLVTGIVNGLIEVDPGRVDFGMVVGDSKVTRKVSIAARGLDKDEILAVDEKKIEPDFIGATIQRHPDSDQVWWLEVFVKPDRPVGRFEGFVPIVDSKGEPRVNVAIEGTIGHK